MEDENQCLKFYFNLGLFRGTYFNIYFTFRFVMDESLLNLLFLIFLLIAELEFTMIATKNPGFYNITDSNGGYVYPLIVQSMALPIIEVAVKLNKLNKPLAALIRMAEDAKEKYEGTEVPIYLHYADSRSGTISRSYEGEHKENIEKVSEKIIIPEWDEDKVVALRVHEWPTDTRNFKKRKRKFKRY